MKNIKDTSTEEAVAVNNGGTQDHSDDNKRGLYRTMIYICVAVLVLSLAAMAYLGVKKVGGGGISWTLSDTGVLTIKGSGDMDDFDPKDLKEWLDLSAGEEITKIVVKEGITSVGDYAFYKCAKVKEVSLPESLKEIGKFSFQGCTQLKKIKIPSGVAVIGEGAFYGCSFLNSIDLPKGLETVEYDAFYGTGYYNDDGNWDGGVLYIDDCLLRVNKDVSGAVKVKTGTRYIADSAFCDRESVTGIELPEGLEAIGADAFVNCKKLYSVTVPTTLKYVGANAFGSCSRLTAVYFDGSLEQWLGIDFTDEYSSPLRYAKSIENDAFRGDVVIPDGVTFISTGAFSNCKDITSITLPATVAYVEDNAFYGCDAVASFKVAADSTYYKAIDGVLFTADGGTLVCYPAGSSATEYTVPEDVTAIAQRAFAYNRVLTSVTMNDGLLEIGSKAFLQCSAITDIIVPDTVTTIGSEAFADCIGANTLVLSDSTVSVGGAAFAGLANVEALTLAGDLSDMSHSDFRSFASVKELTVDESLSAMDIIGFMHLKGAEQKVFEEGNGWIKHEADCIISADGTELLLYLPMEDATLCTVPDGVTVIGTSAFEGAELLEEVVLPQSLERIESNAFCGMSALKAINLHSGIKYLSDGAFEGSDGVNEQLNAFYESYMPPIENEDDEPSTEEEPSEDEPSQEAGAVLSSDGKVLLGYNPGAEEVLCKVPEGVEVISDGAFSGWDYLEEIVLADSIREISDDAFGDCGNVIKITLSGDFATVNSSVFSSLNGVVTVVLADGLVNFDITALHCFKNLQEAVIEENNGQFVCNGNGYFSKDGSALVFYMPDKGETSYTIPDGVTVIGDRALDKCRKFTKIVIPEGVKEIGNNAFSGWEYLNEVVLPDGLVSIGDAAFSDCYALEEIVLPDSVVSLGTAAFFGCTALKSINLPQGLVSVGDQAFFYCSNLYSLKLPDGFSAEERCRVYGSAFFVMESEWGKGALYLDGCLLSVSKEQKGAFAVADGTFNIADYAFMYCADLVEVVIPESVLHVGLYAFLRCDSLETVYYGGTEEQWNAIIDGKWDKEAQGFTVVFAK